MSAIYGLPHSKSKFADGTVKECNIMKSVEENQSPALKRFDVTPFARNVPTVCEILQATRGGASTRPTARSGFRPRGRSTALDHATTREVIARSVNASIALHLPSPSPKRAACQGGPRHRLHDQRNRLDRERSSRKCQLGGGVDKGRCFRPTHSGRSTGYESGTDCRSSAGFGGNTRSWNEGNESPGRSRPPGLLRPEHKLCGSPGPSLGQSPNSCLGPFERPI